MAMDFGMDLNFLAGAPKHGGTAHDDIIDVRRLDLVFAAAGQSQQLFGQIRGAADVFLNRGDMLVMGMAAR